MMSVYNADLNDETIREKACFFCRDLGDASLARNVLDVKLAYIRTKANE